MTFVQVNTSICVCVRLCLLACSFPSKCAVKLVKLSWVLADVQQLKYWWGDWTTWTVQRRERSHGETYLYGHGVSDPSGQQFEHFHVAAQQAQRVGAGMGLLVCVFIAEGVDDVHHDCRRIRHCVRLSVCRLPHFVPLYSAIERRTAIGHEWI